MQRPSRLHNLDINRPVEGITWDEARDFCSRLTHFINKCGRNLENARADLPSETQWEYACRAGTTERWFFGEDGHYLEDYAWYASNSGGHSHPVATLRPNPWGIYDIYGNVAEWCLDEFRRYGENEVIDPKKFSEQGLMKIIRGGDFASTANECRSACRAFCDRTNAYNEPTGLRPVIKQSDMTLNS
jgi:formylglycine-generating enzyme required for sulfatase activity